MIAGALMRMARLVVTLMARNKGVCGARVSHSANRARAAMEQLSEAISGINERLVSTLRGVSVYTTTAKSPLCAVETRVSSRYRDGTEAAKNATEMARPIQSWTPKSR